LTYDIDGDINDDLQQVITAEYYYCYDCEKAFEFVIETPDRDGCFNPDCNSAKLVIKKVDFPTIIAGEEVMDYYDFLECPKCHKNYSLDNETFRVKITEEIES